MNPEERKQMRDRLAELSVATQGEATAGAIVLLGDRIVGVLDGILSALRAIEDKLDAVNPQPPQTTKKEQR
jgi:hypothetical protein